MPNPSGVAASWEDPEYTPSAEEILANVRDAYDHPGTEELVEDVQLVGRFKPVPGTSEYRSTLKQWQVIVHALAKEKGFWNHEWLEADTAAPLGDQIDIENPSIIPEKLLLIVGEISEAMEDFRDNDFEHLSEELADVLIRLLDLSEHLGIDLYEEMIKKHEKNTGRPYLHGRVR